MQNDFRCYNIRRKDVWSSYHGMSGFAVISAGTGKVLCSAEQQNIISLDWCKMLKAVITCLPDIDAELVSELNLNQVNVIVVERRAGEDAELWLKRISVCVKEQGLQVSECIVVASDRALLKNLTGAGWKVIGYTEAIAEKNDLFGCCDYIAESWEGISFAYVNRVFCRLERVPLVIAVTERLIIRELVPEDIPCLCKICGQDAVRTFISDVEDDLQKEAEKHRAYIEQAYRFYDYGYWGVYDKQTGELIGRCGIQDNMVDGVPEVELGYLVTEERQGQGYAKEAVKAVLAYAFEELDIFRVAAVIDKSNTASLRVAEHCGLQWEKDIVKQDGGKRTGRICSIYAITPEIFGLSNVQTEDR